MSSLLSDNLCSSFQNIIVRSADIMRKVVCVDIHVYSTYTTSTPGQVVLCHRFFYVTMSNWPVTVSTESDRRHCPAIILSYARHSNAPTSKQNRNCFIYIGFENISKSKISLFGYRWPFKTINTNNDSMLV